MPLWTCSLSHDWGRPPLDWNAIAGGIQRHGIRNGAQCTIAPTGTLSIIAGCSSGIEPLFALSYMRNILDGAHMVEVNPHFEEAAKDGGFYSDELMQSLAEGTPLQPEAVPWNQQK